MDNRSKSTSPHDLYARSASEAAPIAGWEIRTRIFFALPTVARTLSLAGRIALWAKGDGVTRFDQIENHAIAKRP